MKRYITGGYIELIETVTLERESEHTIWYLDKKGRKQSCRKKSAYAMVWNSFDEAKEYLLQKESKHIEQLNNWLKSSIERTTKICALSE